MPIDSLLTILLPVKDRPRYTKRVLTYLEQQSCSFKIVIADGSATDMTMKVVEQFLHSAKLKIDYVRYPPDLDLIAFMRKMSAAVERVDTKYIVWACDDDFYNLSELANGVQFLENNPDFATYTGEVIDFNVLPRPWDRTRVHGILVIDEAGRFCSGRYRLATSIDDNTARLRLTKVTAAKTIEGIHTTKSFKFAINSCSQGPVWSKICFVIPVVALLEGKLFHSNSVILLRQDNTENSAGDSLTTSALQPIEVLNYQREVQIQTSREIMALQKLRDGEAETLEECLISTIQSEYEAALLVGGFSLQLRKYRSPFARQFHIFQLRLPLIKYYIHYLIWRIRSINPTSNLTVFRSPISSSIKDVIEIDFIRAVEKSIGGF